MPILSVKVGAKKAPGLTQKIGETLIGLTSRILGKSPEVTAIAIEYVDPGDWIIAGKTLAEHGRNSIYFDIKVTDETNTKEEKARFIEEAFHAFDNLLGPLHDESYIYVQDVRATSYGYGGKTQEYRYQHK
ncbi:tautomerase family protein [Massilia horti]|uniref:4-oxalocrotonate tautomerase family protein n=1 Tax=Massilia horti TaxID=2562153 RepID=A0A4Y9SZM3_9BURK|nr:4-oxalocrotonate tautomerase family protein [Massilia horti]TFW31900.1 4-oxalocrotonate tautomerase family protein [Massilia horti]